jgi:type I restriction enzyme, S subunit
MSFPRYPKYKDSGVEWLGEVPGHWGVKPLKAVSTHNDDVLDETTAPDTEIVYVDISGVDGVTGISSKETILFSAAPSRARRRVRHGDVIVSTVRTYLRAIARIRDPEENLIVSTGFAVVRPRSQLAPDFLGYLLSANHFVEQVIARSTGVSYPAINASELVGIPVSLPPLPEQTAIAAFLDRETAKIDALVAEQQRLMDLLKEKRQAVISHAVTKGLNPHAPMKSSGIEWLDDVPEHWEVVKLFHMATEIGDGLHGTPEYVDQSSFYFVNGNNLANGSICITDTTRCVSEAEFSKHRVALDQTSLLLSINGTIGNLALYRDESVILGKSAAYVNCGKNVAREFLYWFLQSSSITRYFDLSVTGTTISNLSLQSIRTLPVVLPPLEEQLKVIAALTELTKQLDSLTAEAQRAIDLLQERRTALISAAVTGQVDVRNHAAPSVKSVSSAVP